MPKVLLAEDNQKSPSITWLRLRAAGFETVQAEYGDAVLERLSHDDTFDALLVDITMPETNGMETIKLVRFWEVGRERSERIPIIAMTLDDRNATRNECLLAGADACLRYPIFEEELVTTLSDCLKRTGGRNESKTPIEAGAFEAAMQVSEREMSDLYHLGGASFILSLADEFEIDASVAVANLSAALEANSLELFQANVGNVYSASIHFTTSLREDYKHSKRLTHTDLNVFGPILARRIERSVSQILALLRRFAKEHEAGP